MNSVQKLSTQIGIEDISLIVGGSEIPDVILPQMINDFVWCDSADFSTSIDVKGARPVVVSWRDQLDLARVIITAGEEGAWVMVDSTESLEDISALDSTFRMASVDFLDEVPFILTTQSSCAGELSGRDVLMVAVASCRTQESRKQLRQAVLSEIPLHLRSNAASQPQRALGQTQESKLRKRIKSVLGGREKQLAAKLPRPLFRAALRVWKAL